MKIADKVKHRKNDYAGVVVAVHGSMVEVLWVNPEVYHPMIHHASELRKL